MARERELQQTGLVTPADAWVLGLSAGGTVLLSLAGAPLGSLPYGDPAGLVAGVGIVWGVVHMLTGFFFCAAVPGPGSVRSERLTRLTLWCLIRVPRPSWLRAAALVACWLPFAVIEPLPVSGLAAGAALAALALGELAFDRGRPEPNRWDPFAPWLFVAVNVLYAWGLDTPGQAGAAYLVSWTAELLFLRRACARHWAAMAIRVQADRGAPTTIASLAAYAAQLEADAPPVEEAPALEGAPLHVAAGTFRVDASRMLDKLRERQLADASDFGIAWLRCADASGSKRILVETGWREWRMSFDGRPFTEGQLNDPYRPLLDSDAPEAVRGAQFAYGLLAALRFNPRSVHVLSGPKDARLRLCLAARDERELDPFDPGDATVIALRFSSLLDAWRMHRATRRLSAAFGLSDAQLWVQGRETPDPYDREDWRTFKRGDWHVEWKPRAAVVSLLRYYRHGALVEELETPIPGDVQLEAGLTHPGLRLSLSQASVVRDAAFQESLDVLSRGVR